LKKKCRKCPKCGEELNIWVEGSALFSTETIGLDCPNEKCSFESIELKKCWVPVSESKQFEKYNFT
jgi:hypothetical protein